MTGMADMLETLAMAIESRGIKNHNETFVLNLAQREWISTSLRHEATRLREKSAWNVAIKEYAEFRDDEYIDRSELISAGLLRRLSFEKPKK
jgi:hypothetical protein